MDDTKDGDPLHIEPKKKTSKKYPPPPTFPPPPMRQPPPYPYITTPQEDEAIHARLHQHGLEYGNILRRIIATIIDGIIIYIATFIILNIIFFGAYGRSYFYATMFFAFSFNGIYALLSFFYFWFLEASPEQATFGKRFMQLKVIDDEHFHRIDTTRSAFRTLGRLLWNLPMINVLILIFDGLLVLTKFRRIGDYLGHTLVVEPVSTPSILSNL